MKIAFVFPINITSTANKPIRVQTSINLGISYMSSALKHRGHMTRLFVLTRNNQHHIERSLAEFSPQLVCFTAVSTTYYLARNFSTIYKKRHPDTFLLAGGCYVSLNPETVIADMFDAICVGEGEYPVVELVERLEMGLERFDIPNIWRKNGTAIVRNPTRPVIENLDDLIFPDRAVWNEWIRYPQTTPAVLISRGCPFNCTYCCHHKLSRLAQGKYYRFRSPTNILDEIKDVVEMYPETKEILLETETIYINLNYIQDLCSVLQKFNSTRVRPIAFSANLRIMPNTNYDSLFQSLHQGNFSYISIGLESGSEKVRSAVLNRNYSNDDIIRTIASARRHGLKTQLYVMIGLPGETRSDFQQTIELIRKCQPDICTHNMFYPYPGTEIFRLCNEQHLIDKRVDVEGVNERRQPVLSLPEFSAKQVLRSFIWFDYKAFKGHKPLYKLLFRTLQNMVLTSPILEKVSNYLLDIEILFLIKNRLVN